MTIYKVSQAGNDTTGTGSDFNPYKSLTKVGPLLLPGDELLVQGRMTTQLVPGASGTAAKPITVRGLENAELTKQVSLGDRQHIILDRLTLTSTGSMWVHTNKASGHNALINCRLDSGPYVPPADGVGTGYPFVGLLLYGDRNRLINPTVGTWYGGDAIQIWGDYNLVQDGDWSQCRCGHGPLMVFGNTNVVQGKARKIPVTNPWGRAFEMLGKYSNGVRNLMENIVVTDTNWDGVTPWQGHRADKDGQLFKTGGDGAIFRDIEVRRSQGPTYPYACIMHIGNYGDPAKTIISTFKNLRFYDLVIEDNPQNAMAITYNNTMAFDCSNNRVFNSIFRRNEHSFWLQTQGAWLDTFYIEDSLIAEPIRRGNSLYTIEEYQARFPQARRNSSTVVPPKAPLTHVTASSVGDVLTLDDALPLSDGNTLVPGDIVVVGAKRVQVREWLDDKHVRLMEATTVRSGDKVWREKQYAPSGPPTEPPAPPPVIVEPPPVVVVPPPEPEPVPTPQPEPVPVPVIQVNIAILVEGTRVTVSVDDQPVYSTP